MEEPEQRDGAVNPCASPQDLRWAWPSVLKCGKDGVAADVLEAVEGRIARLAASAGPEEGSAMGCGTPRSFGGPETRLVTRPGLLCWVMGLSATGVTESSSKTKHCQFPGHLGICHLTQFMWKAIAKRPVDNLFFLASTSCC